MKSYPSYKSSDFGLISRIPTHWNENTIKRGFEITLGKMLQSESKKDTDFLAPYLRSANVQSGKVDVSDVQEMWFSPSEAIQLALELGDLVVCEGGDAGRAAFWNGEIEVCFFQNAVNRVRSCGGNSPKYLMYWLCVIKDGGYLDIICNKATIAHLTKEKLSNLPMLYPPHDEQIDIAAYLDAETVRIDALINEKTDLLGLLLELRGSIIRELTAGLHLDAAKQDTGNVFMPSVPSNWDMAGIGRFASIGNGSTPLKDTALYWEGGTYPWLNSAVVNQDEVTEGSELVTHVALKQCHLPIVPAGCVLVALTGQGKTRGQATMLRIEATINQHLAYLLPDEDRLDGEYLFWVLSGQFSALRMVSDGQGGTKGALTCEDLRRFQIPLPPFQVQKEIAARLYEDTRRVDDLVQYAKKEIAVLVELRASTITDAVLGRIDVRKTKNN